MNDMTVSQPNSASEDVKATWVAPVVSKVQAGDAESGINVSENGATGS